MRLITFQNVLQESQFRQANDGERAYTPDGRRWRYAKANEAITLGHATTRTANSDVDTVSSSANGRSQTVFVTETSAGWTAGQFANAYGLVDAGTGEGQFFKIKDNTADTLELFEDYALSTDLDVSDSDIVIARTDLAEKTAITTLNQILIGVAQISITSAYYAWHLEKGPGSVIAGAALTANEQATPGDDTEGEVKGVASGETVDDASSVGRCLVANSTADKAAMVDTNIW